MHSVIWAPPGTALPPTEPARSSTTAWSARWRCRRGGGRGRGARAGPVDVRMLILMGAISEAATGYVIAGKPELTPELADRIIDTIIDGWKI